MNNGSAEANTDVYTVFEMHGFTYRTNADASIVQALDGKKWNRTGSLNVILQARDLMGIKPHARNMEPANVAARNERLIAIRLIRAMLNSVHVQGQGNFTLEVIQAMIETQSGVLVELQTVCNVVQAYYHRGNVRWLTHRVFEFIA